VSVGYLVQALLCLKMHQIAPKMQHTETDASPIGEGDIPSQNPTTINLLPLHFHHSPPLSHTSGYGPETAAYAIGAMMDHHTYVPNNHLMTSRELTSGFDFWSRGHLRMAVMHYP